MTRIPLNSQMYKIPEFKGIRHRATEQTTDRQSATGAITTQTAQTDNFNIDDIVAKLQDGDLKALEELEISENPYTQVTLPTGLVKIQFKYNGAEYKLCVQVDSIESTEKTEDKENNNTTAIDKIIQRLENGDKNALKDLKSLGIEYSTIAGCNSGILERDIGLSEKQLAQLSTEYKVITFEYNGKEYCVLITDPTQPDFIKDVMKRIAQGDTSVLKELDKNGIKYTTQETSGSITVKFEYNGKNYMIVGDLFEVPDLIKTIGNGIETGDQSVLKKMKELGIEYKKENSIVSFYYEGHYYEFLWNITITQEQFEQFEQILNKTIMFDFETEGSLFENSRLIREEWQIK